jgi:LmbE family N-acetylglucosaminyl deacetylase
MGSEQPEEIITRRAAVIVAHPDDETLWAGGYILSHPEYQWFILSLCRASDLDRAPKFARVVQELGATGKITDLDDGPDQIPLPSDLIDQAILSMLPPGYYQLILTHGPHGEYTRHRRHEEASEAVSRLWQNGRIHSEQVCQFAYEDHQRQTLPVADHNADLVFPLSTHLWQKKYRLIVKEYGFSPQSWEARSTPQVEAFWWASNPHPFQKKSTK